MKRWSVFPKNQTYTIEIFIEAQYLTIENGNAMFINVTKKEEKVNGDLTIPGEIEIVGVFPLTEITGIKGMDSNMEAIRREL